MGILPWLLRHAVYQMVGIAAVVSGIASAQISLSGNFANKTLNIGKGMNKVMLTVLTDHGQAQATGGVTVKEGDKVSFDSRGGLIDTAGFWEGASQKVYRVLLRPPAQEKPTATPVVGNNQMWLMNSASANGDRTMITDGPGGKEIMGLFLQEVSQDQEPRPSGAAVIEVQGAVRWDTDRDLVYGKDNLLRISIDGNQFLAITDHTINNGTLYISSEDGTKYKIYALSSDFTAAIEKIPSATEVMPGQLTSKPKDKYKIEEVRVGPVLGEALSGIFSPDGQHLAYIAHKGPKSSVVVDGQPGTDYDGIFQSPVFSPDSKRVAYAAKKGAQWLVLVDGSASGGSAYEGVGVPIFSPDGKRVAYLAVTKSKAQLIVVDGQPGTEFGGVGVPTFSPDSKRVAYGAQKGKARFMVVDGQPGAEYDGVGAPTFSPDGRRLAYRAQKGEKWFAVVDGQQDAEYDGLGTPTFSPDGKRVAYAAQKGARQLVVVDGHPGTEYALITGTPVFSPDGKRVAYTAQKDAKPLLVLDDQEMVVDCDRAYSPIFSPDGKRVAYVAQKGAKQVVVVDGQAGEKYNGTRKGTPIFSPDGKRLVYVAIRGAKWLVVVDGQPGAEYDLVTSTPIFNPAGDLEYYGVKEGSLYNVKYHIPIP